MSSGWGGEGSLRLRRTTTGEIRKPRRIERFHRTNEPNGSVVGRNAHDITTLYLVHDRLLVGFSIYVLFDPETISRHLYTLVSFVSTTSGRVLTPSGGGVGGVSRALKGAAAITIQ